jgi:hypothetical protein
MVGTLTDAPPAAARERQSSASVESRLAFTSLRSRERSLPSIDAFAPPAWGIAAIEPVRVRRRSSFCTNERLTPKRSATSSRVSTRSSQAAQIRSLRSNDRASMPHLRRQLIPSAYHGNVCTRI